MRTLILLSTITLMLVSGRLSGQSTYVDVFSLKISSLDINRSFSGEIESGDIFVNGIDGDSIRIVAEVYNAPGKNYKCKQDECMVVDQTYFHFSVKPREGERIKKVEIYIPKYMSISIKIINKGSIVIDKMHSEIQIISNRVGNVDIKDAKGPLSISATYGNINIDFNKGISRRSMAISLVKGNINIATPKGEAVTFASSCFEEKSTLKELPINQSNSFKLISGTVLPNDEKNLTGKRNMIINAKYQERIESRKFLMKGVSRAKQQKDKKVFRTKEDVYIYEINGGGTNIELNIYQGLIRIDEKN